MKQNVSFMATYLLDEISRKLGLTEDLKSCFPQTYKQILSIAYYMVLEDRSPLSRFEKWNDLHRHPYGQNIPSQRSSELFASISEAAKNQFFALRGKRHSEKEYWAYDTTSISSYSETLKQVCYGKNKEDDSLPQINLALVFGEDTCLPFYYRKLAGNIPDVKTLKHLLFDLEFHNFKKVKLIMDRGFYREVNVNALLKEHLKFIVATKTSLSFVRKELDKAKEIFTSFEHFNEQYELYSTTVMTDWNYKQERPYKKDVHTEKRRVYLHFYYNIDKATEDKKNFDRHLMACRRELMEEKQVSKNENFYKKYFTMSSTPKRGIKITINEEAVRNAKKYYGFFALLSNEKMDSIAALELYRNKDVVEKAFGDLKDRLNMRRTLVSSDQSLDGKLFVAFVGLILLSYIKKQMQDNNLFGTYTIQSLLDKLDVIECFENSASSLRVGELLQNQIHLFDFLDVAPPA